MPQRLLSSVLASLRRWRDAWAAKSRWEKAGELLFFVLCAGVTWPLWSARYLPIQDLPQHLAAIRVMHSYSNPAFDFAPHFELQLAHTQYLLYYVTVDLLSYVLDLELANLLVLVSAVFATPYAIRALLRAQGRDEWLALLALPLAYHAHLLLGFVNFVWAIAILFFGLALAVRQRSAPTRARAVGLAVTLLACFYAHIVPFGLLGIGVVLVSIDRDLRASLARLLPVVPSALAAGLWLLRTPAGRSTLDAAAADSAQSQLYFEPTEERWDGVFMWLTDILHGDEDREALVWFFEVAAALALAGLVWLAIEAWRRRKSGEKAPARGPWLRLALLPIVAALLYLFGPTSYDWIWPIAPRFALLALLLVIPVIPSPPPKVAAVFLAAVVGLAALQTAHVREAFTGFDTEEVGDLDEALAALPEGASVAGLIFARGSRFVHFSPFLHYVAYHQARRGGVVMFTFADFPQSPFRFREERRPPRVVPRWEWMPERVSSSDLEYYDYVLVRGGPGRIGRDRVNYRPVYEGAPWTVWQRVR